MKTLVKIVKEHVLWRKQIIKLAKADIVKTYSGAALGWAWAIIKPTVMVLVLWFAFSVGLRVDSEVNGYPYILWILAGMIPWFYMQSMIGQGAGAILRYKYLVTKMKFPVSTIPTFVGLSKLMVHFFLIGIMIAIFIVLGHFPGKYILQLPIYLIMMVVFFTFWSLFASMLSAMSKDFLNLVKSFVTPVFWLSGIMYDVSKIKVDWIQNVMMFNPVSYFATGYRNIFIYEKWIWEDRIGFVCFMVVFVLMAAAAVWAYNRTVKEIPDIL
ncbi:MAG: ABC transporter permease [Anaerovoracaceae bacterium]